MNTAEIKARWLIAAARQKNPDVVRLARIASLAVEVEPQLLRRARLKLLPGVEAGVEADLWFSPLVHGRSALAIALVPEVIALLRDELRQPENQELLQSAWNDVISFAHRHAPPLVQLEEKVTWLALLGEDVARAAIDEELQRVRKSMVEDQGRSKNLARWALGAMLRTPPDVWQSDVGWTLLLGAHSILDVSTVNSGQPASSGRGTTQLPIPLNSSSTMLGVRLVPNGLQLGSANLPGAIPIRVRQNDIQPALVNITWEADGIQQLRVLRITPGQIITLAIRSNEFSITTDTGDHYILRPEQPDQVDQRNSVYRRQNAFGSGMSVAFADSDLKLAYELANGFLRNSGRVTIPLLTLEKLLVLLIQLGARIGFLEPWHGVRGIAGIVEIRFDSKGARTAFSGGLEDGTGNSTWLSRYILSRGVLKLGSIASNRHFELGRSLESNAVSDSASAKAYELGSILGMLYKSSSDREHKDAPLNDRALTILTTCSSPHSVAAALQAEIYIFRNWYANIGQASLIRNNWNSLDSVTETLRSLLSSSGYEALHTLRLMFVSYKDLELESIVETCGKYLEDKLGIDLVANTWRSYWDTIRSSEGINEKNRFDPLSDRIAVLAWEMMACLSLIEISLLAGRAVLSSKSNDPALRRAFQKLWSYDAAMLSIGLSRPKLVSSLVERLREIEASGGIEFDHQEAAQFASSQIKKKWAEVYSILEAAGMAIEDFGRLGGHHDYDYMLYYDIIDSTGKTIGQSRGNADSYHDRVTHFKVGFDNSLRRLQIDASKNRCEIFAWEDTFSSKNDSKYLFFSGSAAQKYITEAIRLLMSKATARHELQQDFRLRIYLVPCDLAGTRVYRLENETDIQGEAFWEHWSRFLAVSKRYQKKRSDDFSFLLVADERLIKTFKVPDDLTWLEPRMASITTNFGLLSRKTRVRYGGLHRRHTNELRLRIAWPTGLSSARLVKTFVKNDPDVPLDEAKDLIGRLFPDASKVRLALETGTTQTLKSAPDADNLTLYAWEDGKEAVILKISSPHQTELEVARYSQYIGGRLRGRHYARLKLHMLLWDLGGAVYELLGASPESTQRFSEYYHEGETGKIIMALETFFLVTWITHYTGERRKQERSLFDAYSEHWGANWRDHLLRGVTTTAATYRASRRASYINPVRWLINKVALLDNGDTSDTSDLSGMFEAVTHGALQGDNILADEKYKEIWVINYESVGYGPILRDFTSLEVDILIRIAKFPVDLSEYNALIEALIAPKDLSAPLVGQFDDPNIQKAFEVVQSLRRLAFQVTGVRDYRQYYWGLLMNAVYQITKLKGKSNHFQIERAFRLGGAICQRLDNWQRSDIVPPQIDVAILIALKEEFRYLFSEIGENAKSIQDKSTSRYYYLFDSPKSGGQRSFRCLATFIGKMRKEKAAILTTQIIDKYAPTTFVLLGIAGSLDKDVKLGDVLITTGVENYFANSKAVPTGDPKRFTFELSGASYTSTEPFVRFAENFEFAHPRAYRQWLDLCRTEYDQFPLDEESFASLLKGELLRDVPQIHEGHLASGSAVSASNAFTKWLRSMSDRTYLAIDMESVGATTAVGEVLDPARTLVIMGISDYADERKNSLEYTTQGIIRSYAVHNSMRLLWSFFSSNDFPR
ncbi:MAG TPA: hypothetical protein VJ183_11210 [Chloroflexia bacterium]|nr:hypothetical protein [Chloroflexia bacterium]